MRVLLPLLLLAALPAPALCGPITYNLRAAHFFGGTPGDSREINQGGAFTSATSESLPYTFSTGGGTPSVFTGSATSQGAPFQLTASNLIDAGTSSALQANLPPNDPIQIVSLVQSLVQENGLLATGATGEAYLLPTFRLDGATQDAHATAFARLSVCAGIASCAPTGVLASSGGTQTVDTLFTPSIGSSTKFTFGTPFNLFFFVSADVQSFSTTLQADGPVGGNARLRLVGYEIVDVNGDPISGVSLTSDLLNPVPEPATLLLTAGGLMVLMRRRRPTSK